MTRGQLSFQVAILAFFAARGAVAEERESAPHVHAPLPGSDGVYGRLDGSLTLGLAAGVELEAGEPGASLRLSGHYLWTAGGYLHYSDAFGGGSERSARALGLGVEVRPLFLPRFALDSEQGPALLDLTLDSLALSGGAYFSMPQAGSFGDERGFELGLGLAVPLLAQAEGPWLSLRAARRFADEGEDSWLFSLELGFHMLILTTDSPQ
jgi:hypothetical protein